MLFRSVMFAHQPRILHVAVSPGGNGDVLERAHNLVRNDPQPPRWETDDRHVHPVDVMRWSSVLDDALSIATSAHTQDVRLPDVFVQLVAHKWHMDALLAMHTEIRENIPGCSARGTSILWLQWLLRAYVLHVQNGDPPTHEAPMSRVTWRWTCDVGLSAWVTPPTASASAMDLESVLDVAEHAFPHAIDYTSADTCTQTLELATSYIAFVETAAHLHSIDIFLGDDSQIPDKEDIDLSRRAALVLMWMQRNIEISRRLMKCSVVLPDVRSHDPDTVRLAGILVRASGRIREWARSRIIDTTAHGGVDMGSTFWKDFSAELMSTWRARPSDGRMFAAGLNIASGTASGARWTEVLQRTHGVNEVRFWFRDAMARPPAPIDPISYTIPDDLTTHVLGVAGFGGTKTNWWADQSDIASRCVFVLRLFDMLCSSDPQALLQWRRNCVIPAKAVFSRVESIVSETTQTPLLVLLPWWQPLVLVRSETGSVVYDATCNGALDPVDAMWAAVALWLALVHTQHGGAISTSNGSAHNLFSMCMRFCAP